MTTPSRTSPCPSCGAVLSSAEAGFCSSCGAQSFTAAAPGGQLPDPAGRYRLVPPDRCPACGAAMDDFSDGMCLACGVESEPSTERVPRVVALTLARSPC